MNVPTWIIIVSSLAVLVGFLIALLAFSSSTPVAPQMRMPKEENEMPPSQPITNDYDGRMIGTPRSESSDSVSSYS